ncbi:transglycosylase SLT domain-containing protein [Blochmannia endosymbiont of Polyrhachis (Hedomyrma) turneri]|uniref:transglycosylase SLT domain-containing protein n=1 Tax=Blochmannia endosymbiont of Polyrhachis (Hedomyrma) turneri TaxID=1505596 RepID=UPI00061A7C87|nr:transglycosylase SLT domain-containing protein [Blochmannia endosymbiont of Polyrhachis (Hedomyrma) turneri]AKC59962.1 Endo-type membrane-bound lytic murein transglycosylase A [Blochmannia endosymbiont of Polyrhachis (Hedomyrma) turneri]
MKKYFIYFMMITTFLTNCSKQKQKNFFQNAHKHQKIIPNTSSTQNTNTYQEHIHQSSINYGIDERLIMAIIQVESNYNPTAISKSNAIGLMQLKASTAGKDVYKLKGLQGQPSPDILKNAEINIDCGTAYLSILQKQLLGINNSKTRRYAIIVAYVNGLSTLLNIFSINHNIAIKKINHMTPDKFCRYIKKHHPAPQAQTYLYKVNAVYSLIHHQ